MAGVFSNLQNVSQANERRFARSKSEKIYRRRAPQASPFYQLVRERFDDFERVYPERYQTGYGFLASDYPGFHRQVPQAMPSPA